MLRFHAIVAIGVRVSRRRLEQIEDLRNWKACRRFTSIEVPHDGHTKLRIRKLLASRGIRYHRDIFHKLLIIKELEQRFEFAGLSVDYHQRENAAVRMAIAG